VAAAPENLHDVPEVQLRPMIEADIAEVAAIEKASYAFPWSEGIFRDCVRVGYTCRALDLAGQVIGYGVLSLGAGEAHILNICVRNEFRSLGFGRRLLEHLLERSAAAGVHEAFLEVRPSNLAAIRLYQRLGFQQIGIRRGYYQAPDGREDAIVLKLDLRDRAAT
jgi:[ribosomal protein S18]-alanine N-acetyltransferase